LLDSELPPDSGSGEFAVANPLEDGVVAHPGELGGLLGRQPGTSPATSSTRSCAMWRWAMGSPTASCGRACVARRSTWTALVAVNGSRLHPPHRSRSLNLRFVP
jgi:hypothetical protein